VELLDFADRIRADPNPRNDRGYKLTAHNQYTTSSYKSQTHKIVPLTHLLVFLSDDYSLPLPGTYFIFPQLEA